VLDTEKVLERECAGFTYYKIYEIRVSFKCVNAGKPYTSVGFEFEATILSIVYPIEWHFRDKCEGEWSAVFDGIQSMGGNREREWGF
jgi:hypothetical protein